MHLLKVLVLGSSNFTSTLIELKSYLKFNLFEGISKLDKSSKDKCDILFIHEEFVSPTNKDIINKSDAIKILATNKVDIQNNYDALLKIPTTINEINHIVEKCVAKKTFSKNSSITIKNIYQLDKNEKKLVRDDKTLIITEKEIQLLELLLHHKKPISKNFILSSVWNYSSDADTHTVETHIYRLRKKIKDTFLDESFIQNNKEGYFF